MNVLHIASEAAPIIKVGGLADVVGSLPVALKSLGITAKVALPLYESIFTEHEQALELLGKGAVTFGGKKHWYTVYAATLKQTGMEVYFFRNDEFLSTGLPYFADTIARRHAKQADRFAFFSRVVVDYFTRKSSWKPDVYHCHDWHTGMIPHLLHHEYEQRVGTVFTIHNLAMQGIRDVSVLRILGHDRRKHTPEIDYDSADGNIVFLLQGILGADVINTVSPTYAKEITTPQFGEGLDKVLREHRHKLYGIINGIDYATWDPKKDTYITHQYDASDSEQVATAKVFNKSALYEQIGHTPPTDVPLIGIVSRLYEQKGFQLLREVEEKLLKNTACAFVVLGTGNTVIEDWFRMWSTRSPYITYIDRYDEPLAHQIYSSADMLLIPSKFEPCGLTQMIAMRYGTIPIVHSVGGLKDTVQHLQNGIAFDTFSGQALWRAIESAIATYQDRKTWRKLLQNAHKTNFTWQASAKQYALLYEKVKNRG